MTIKAKGLSSVRNLEAATNNIANFEAFGWNFSSSINLFFMESDNQIQLTVSYSLQTIFCIDLLN